MRAREPKRAREYLNLLGSSIKASRFATTTRFIGSGSFEDTLDPSLPVVDALSFDSIRKSLPHEYYLCSVQHPERSLCSQSAIDMLYAEFWRALSLYAPLNAASFVFIIHFVDHGGCFQREKDSQRTRIFFSEVLYLDSAIGCFLVMFCDYLLVFSLFHSAHLGHRSSLAVGL